MLVQCDADETFYRFPGGTIEYGETAAEAITRELIEEFDLVVIVGALVVVNENIITINGKEGHNCTLLHKCRLCQDSDFADPSWRKEAEGIKLTWKNIEKLHLKPVYPEGILNVLKSMDANDMHHIVVRKSY